MHGVHTDFWSRRSPVLSQRGMVAASQPLAVAAGLETLAAGGNAADAAVATAAALNVTEPCSTGIGGDAFALFYQAASQRIFALNGSGRAPAALSLERLQREGLDQKLPPYHAHTITVPGACAAWHDLVARHGRLALKQVLAPAIRLAEEGFPVAPLTALAWQKGFEEQLRHAPGGQELTINGRAPRPGELFSNPGLARTLHRVAEDGKDAFYQGEIAAAIASAVQAAGGCLSEADLGEHSSTWETPISASYHGVRIWECPPNGQGLAALLALNLLEAFDLEHMDPLGAERLHLEIEAMRLAFADARQYVADPAFVPAPLEILLSKSYAAERRQRIDPYQAQPLPPYGEPAAGQDTVYLSVVDGDGNACSFINSNYMLFGTGIVPVGWGFTLHNRGYNFSLEPQHPNALAPRKRPYHTIIPAMATAPGAAADHQPAADPPDGVPAGDLYASFGVMGGFMQPQGHLQLVLALVNDRLNPQAALDRPRFCLQMDGSVALEDGIPFEVLADLAERGHTIVPTTGLGREIFGRGQAIWRDPQSGVLWAGSDPRADGCAMSV